jgi:hypothetical protein
MPLIRRRRPLLRAAAVGGGAYAYGKHAQRKQEEAQADAYYQGQQSAYADQQQQYDQQAYEQQQAYAQPAAAAPASRGLSEEDTQRLIQLGQLHEQGVLTDDEFAQQKARILGTG